MKNQNKSPVPGIVTVKASEEQAKRIAEAEVSELPLPEQAGLMYDFSTLWVLSGLSPGYSPTEYKLDDDLSHGIQFTIRTVPDPSPGIPKSESITIYKNECNMSS